MSQTKVTDNLRDTTQLDGAKITTGTIPEARITSLTASKLSGALPAISGAALTGLPASGDKRNFIIDGDFTQWPEGTTVTAPSSNKYGPALWHASLSGGHVFNYVKETSVLPTLAQSGHSSKQCMKIDVTTAESSVASGERFLLDYVITGTDYQRLEGQEVTLSFWVRSGLTGTFYVTFKNGNDNRFYMSAQTINAVNTWEKKTITLTLDTADGATWLYTEADQGLTIRITLMSGTDRQDSGAVNTWLTGASKDSKSDQTNFLSDTSKDFYLSQVGLYLGATAPTFTPLPLSTIKQQLEYYIQVYGGSGNYEIISRRAAKSATLHQWELPFRNPMRVAPTATVNNTPGNFWVRDAAGGGGIAPTTVTSTVDNITAHSCLINGTTGTGFAAGEPNCLMNSGTTSGTIKFDARH